MDIQGTFIKLLEPVTGEGKNGPWKKQEFIIELPGDFPKKLCIANWNDKADLNGLKEGDTVKVFFDVESREFNSRWYTDAKAWKLEKVGGSAGSKNNEVSNDLPPDMPSSFSLDDEPGDDLPF